MNYISTANMSREDWLKERKNGIGGSDCAAVLGFSKYRTPVDVWIDKTSPESSGFENMAMKIGTIAEQAIIKPLFMEQEGKRVIVDNKIRLHPKYPQLRANLDGLVATYNKELGTGVWEAKSTSSRALDAVNGLYPPEYFLQCQHNMMVTGFKYAWLSIWIKDRDQFAHHFIERNDSLIDQIESRLLDFWEVNVKGNVVPPPTNPEDLDKIYKESKPSKIEATEPIVRAFNEILDIDEKIGTLETEKETLTFMIKEFMLDNEELYYEGAKLATFRDNIRFNEGMLKAKNVDLYNAYRTAFNAPQFKRDHQSLYDLCKDRVGRTFRTTKTKIEL